MKPFFYVDNVILEQSGVVCIRGWINRVVCPVPNLDVKIGANALTISLDELCFYRRPDTEQFLLEDHLQGFICVKKIDGYAGGTSVSVGLCGQLEQFERSPDIQSTASFIQSVALEHLEIVHHSPLSIRLRAASYFHQKLIELWKKYVNDSRAEVVFRLGSGTSIETSIVTVIYGTSEYLRVQYPMLARQAGSSRVELVLVMNNIALEDSFFDEISSLYFVYGMPVTVVMLDRNSGFSMANNIGVKESAGNKIILMNPDIFPNHNCSTGFQSFLSLPDDELKDAIWSSLLLYGNGALMHAGMYVDGDIVAGKAYPTPLPVARIEHYGKGDIGQTFGNKPFFEVPAVSGALMLMHRKHFEQLDGLSTEYIYAHYEDADFCLRACEQGITSKVINQPLFYHLEGVSKHETPIGIFTRDANRMFFSRVWQDETLAAISRKTCIKQDALAISKSQNLTTV